MAIESVETPLHKRLSPDAQDSIHGTLITAFRQMIEESQRFIEQRFPVWNAIDHHLRIYLNLQKKARAGDWSNVDDTTMENPWRRSILIPLSYSAIMSRMALMFQFFTGKMPFAHLSGREGQDRTGARLHEAAIDYDAQQSRVALQVWQMLYDAERYGLAVWHDTWEEHYGWTSKPPMVPEAMHARLPEGMKHLAEPSEEWSLLKEWNNWRTIDPRTILPDPTVPVVELQAGTRFGHWEMMNWLDLKGAMLVDGNGPYFNVARAQHLGRDEVGGRDQGGNDVSGDFQNSMMAPFDKYPNLKIYHLFWKLIPKDWGLSPKEYPEIWQFAIAEKGLIVRAHPLVYAHQQFPYSAGTPDYDAHSAFSPGMAEQLYGIQDVSTWLVNAHIVNTRKVLHDRVVVNDELIRVDDFMNPNPAQKVRLTAEGKRLHRRGMQIDSMYSQLKLSDITRQHLETAGMLLQWAQRMSATPDPIQSMPLASKRTLGEIQEVKQSGTARIDTPAALLDLQIVKEVIERAIINRQQLTSIEQWYRLDGELAAEAQATGLFIKRSDLYGQYDYIARTPSMADDPARSVAMWSQILLLLGQNPHLMGPNPETGRMLNPHSIFEELVRAGGVNYLDKFYMGAPPQMLAGAAQTPLEAALAGGAGGPPGIVPDEEIAAAEQKGTVVPLEAVR
jgi:hypothetical protein